MNHLGTKQLITPRLLLRKFTIDDCSAAFKNWMNDERVTKYVRWNVHQDIEVTKNIISSWVSSYSNHNFYHGQFALKILMN